MPKKEVRNPNRFVPGSKTPIADYLKAKDIRDNRLWRFLNGRLVTFFNCETISIEEWDKRFPVPSPLLVNGDNPNKRKNYR